MSWQVLIFRPYGFWSHIWLRLMTVASHSIINACSIVRTIGNVFKTDQGLG